MLYFLWKGERRAVGPWCVLHGEQYHVLHGKQIVSHDVKLNNLFGRIVISLTSWRKVVVGNNVTCTGTVDT